MLFLQTANFSDLCTPVNQRYKQYKVNIIQILIIKGYLVEFNGHTVQLPVGRDSEGGAASDPAGRGHYRTVRNSLLQVPTEQIPRESSRPMSNCYNG